MTTPYSDLQNLNQNSAFIELFELDATAIGGTLYRFTPNVSEAGGSMSFAGNLYTAIPIVTTGWDFTSAGAPPKPTLSISNVNKTLLSAVISMGDLVGATLTRRRTFERFLDGSAEADGTMFLGPDTYVIEQKTQHNKNLITWQMTSIIDRLGMRIPRRQILKDKGFPGVSRTRTR